MDEVVPPRAADAAAPGGVDAAEKGHQDADALVQGAGCAMAGALAVPACLALAALEVGVAALRGLIIFGVFFW